MAECSHAGCVGRRLCRSRRKQDRSYERDPLRCARKNTLRSLRRVRARIASKTAQIADMEAQLGLTRSEVPFHG